MPLLNNPDFDSHVDFDAEFEHVPSSLKQQPVSQKDDSEHSSLDDLNRLSQFSDDVQTQLSPDFVFSQHDCSDGCCADTFNELIKKIDITTRIISKNALVFIRLAKYSQPLFMSAYL